MPDSTRRTNVFAGPYVDRMTPRRQDSDAVAAALASAAARIVPLWRSRSLIQREPVPAACLLPFTDALRLQLPTEELILLGEFQGQVAFAAELGGEAPPTFDATAEFVDLRRASGMLGQDEAGLLAYARAMLSWRRRHRYCGFCGTPTRAEQAGHMMACTSESCDAQAFPRLDPAVIVLVTDGERILLGRQASWPPGRFSTIAGFVEPGESLEDAVQREVLEETGVRVSEVRYRSSQPWPFPASLMLGFQARALTTEIGPGDGELEAACWFNRAEIAAGTPSLPPPQSVSFRLIEDWYNAGAQQPLVHEPAVGKSTFAR